MPDIRVYRLRRDNRLRVNSDGGWEIEAAYGLTGPTSELNCYGAVDAVSGLEFPTKGSTHPDNANLIADQVESVWESANDDDGDVWFGRVLWKTNGPLEATDEPLQWQWDQGVCSEQFDSDRDGFPLVNSASDPIVGTVADDVILPNLRVWMTMPIYDPSFAFTIANKVNSDSMAVLGLSIDAEQMRCLYHKPVTKQQAGLASVRTEFAFEFRDGYRPFQPRSIDQGFNGWYDNSGNKRGKFFADGDKERWPDPVLLDGTGKPISAQFKVGYQDSSGGIATFDPIANPSVPSWFEIDPNSPAGGTVLIYSRKSIYDFRNTIPGIM